MDPNQSHTQGEEHDVGTLRTRIKQWKVEFKSKYQREPRKEDIDANAHVKQMLIALQKASQTSGNGTVAHLSQHEPIKAKKKRRRFLLHNGCSPPKKVDDTKNPQQTTPAAMKQEINMETVRKQQPSTKDNVDKSVKSSTHIKQEPGKVIPASKLANDKLKRLHRTRSGLEASQSLSNSEDAATFLGTSQAASKKDLNMTKLDLRRRTWKPRKRAIKKTKFVAGRRVNFANKVIARDLLFSVAQDSSALSPSVKAMQVMLLSNYVYDENESAKYLPKCNGHGLKTVERTVGKKNENFGRKFYSCAMGRKDRCNFFLWEEDNIGKSFQNILDKSNGASKLSCTPSIVENPVDQKYEGTATPSFTSQKDTAVAPEEIVLSSDSEDDKSVSQHTDDAIHDSNSPSSETIMKMIKETPKGSWITACNHFGTPTAIAQLADATTLCGVSIHIFPQQVLNLVENMECFKNMIIVDQNMSVKSITDVIIAVENRKTGLKLVISDEFLLSQHFDFFRGYATQLAQPLVFVHHAESICRGHTEYSVKMERAVHQLVEIFQPRKVVAMPYQWISSFSTERICLPQNLKYSRVFHALGQRDVSVQLFLCEKHQRHQQLIRLLKPGMKKNVKTTLILAGNSAEAENLSRILADHGFEGRALNKWTKKKQKDSIYSRFSSGKLPVVVCSCDSLCNALILDASLIIAMCYIPTIRVWNRLFSGNSLCRPLGIKWLLPAGEISPSKNIPQNVRGFVGHKAGCVPECVLATYWRYLYELLEVKKDESASVCSLSLSHEFLEDALGITGEEFIKWVVSSSRSLPTISTDAPKYCKIQMRTNRLHQYVQESDTFRKIFAIFLILENHGLRRTMEFMKDGALTDLSEMVGKLVNEESYMDVYNIASSYRSTMNQLCALDLHGEIASDGFYIQLISDQTLALFLDLSVLCALWACSPREARIFITLTIPEEIDWLQTAVEVHYSRNRSEQLFPETFSFFRQELFEADFHRAVEEVRRTVHRGDDARTVVTEKIKDALNMAPRSYSKCLDVSLPFEQKLSSLVSEILSRWSDDMIVNNEWHDSPEALAFKHFLDSSNIVQTLFPDKHVKYKELHELSTVVKFLRFNPTAVVNALLDLLSVYDDELTAGVIQGLFQLSHEQMIPLVDECIEDWWEANYFQLEEEQEEVSKV